MCTSTSPTTTSPPPESELSDAVAPLRNTERYCPATLNFRRTPTTPALTLPPNISEAPVPTATNLTPAQALAFIQLYQQLSTYLTPSPRSASPQTTLTFPAALTFINNLTFLHSRPPADRTYIIEYIIAHNTLAATDTLTRERPYCIAEHVWAEVVNGYDNALLIASVDAEIQRAVAKGWSKSGLPKPAPIGVAFCDIAQRIIDALMAESWKVAVSDMVLLARPPKLLLTLDALRAESWVVAESDAVVALPPKLVLTQAQKDALPVPEGFERFANLHDGVEELREKCRALGQEVEEMKALQAFADHNRGMRVIVTEPMASTEWERLQWESEPVKSAHPGAGYLQRMKKCARGDGMCELCEAPLEEG